MSALINLINLIERYRKLAAEIDEIFGAGTARRDAVWCTGAMVGALVVAAGVAAIAGGSQ